MPPSPTGEGAVSGSLFCLLCFARCFCVGQYHAGGGGVVGGFVYQDEGAGGGVGGVGGADDGLRQRELDFAQVVHFQCVAPGGVAEGVHVPHAAYGGDFGGHGAGGVFEQVFAGGVERAAVEPAQGGGKAALRLKRAGGGEDGVAARDVDVVGEEEGGGFACGCLIHAAFEADDAAHAAFEPGGFDADFVAHAHAAGFDAALVAAEVVLFAAVGALHELYGEMEVLRRFGHTFACGQALQHLQQRAALVPRGVGAFVHDVVAIEGGDGDEAGFRQAEGVGQFAVGGGGGVEFFLAEAEQVHFVDGHDDVRAAQVAQDGGVAFGLRQQLQRLLGKIELGGVYEQYGGVGGGGTGYHVAGVLFVAGGVGDDKFAAGGGEVTVGHVDGDALFAFGFEAVGEGGEIDRALAAAAFEAAYLVAEQGFAVVEQAADEGGFAIVHAAGGDEAQGGLAVGAGHDVGLSLGGLLGFQTAWAAGLRCFGCGCLRLHGAG